MLAKILNGLAVKYPFTIIDLKQENPYTIYQPNINLIELYPQTDTGVAEGSFLVEVSPADKPTCNEFIESVVPGMPVQVDSEWVESWVIKTLSDEEKQEKFSIAAFEKRKDRNNLLKDCDWTQLPDAPINKEAWATYRQQLRDISSQEGFPYSIIWPTPPS